MGTINYLQINGFALLILILIYFNIRQSYDHQYLDYKIFLSLIISTALLLIFDASMVLIDGQAGMYARTFNIMITTIYYLLNPVPSFLWILYVIYYIHKDKLKIKRLFLPLSIPLMINSFLSIAGIFFNLLFYIDRNNIYHRGRFFYILVFICYFYMAYAFIYIIINKNRLSKQNFLTMLFFAVPPAIGGLIQTLHYGVATLWSSVTFSILFIYINIQNKQMHTDYLTDLYNRRQLDAHLNFMINRRREGYLLAGMMIDLNDFKKINDIYGHSLGDSVLEETGKLLKKSFRKDDFISRYGGDEFAIILEIKNNDDLKAAKSRLLKNVDEFNAKKIYPFDLSFSIGYDIYDDTAHRDMEDFLNILDRKMYEDKNKIKI